MVHTPAKCANLNLESLSVFLYLITEWIYEHISISLSLSSVGNNRSVLLLPLVLFTPEKPVSYTVIPILFSLLSPRTQKKKRVLVQTRVRKKKKKKKKKSTKTSFQQRHCRPAVPPRKRNCLVWVYDTVCAKPTHRPENTPLEGITPIQVKARRTNLLTDQGHN